MKVGISKWVHLNRSAGELTLLAFDWNFASPHEREKSFIGMYLLAIYLYAEWGQGAGGHD